jgi:propionaldehyde dehydrogenase
MPILPIVRARDIDEAIEMAIEAENGRGHTASMYSRNIEKLSEMARVMKTAIFVENGPSFAGLGLGGEGYTSFTVATNTGEGLTTARTFTRERRCTLVDYFKIV